MTPRTDRLDMTASRIRGYVDSAHANILKTLEVRSDSLHTQLSTIDARIKKASDNLSVQSSDIKYGLRTNGVLLETEVGSCKSLIDLAIVIGAINAIISVILLCFTLAKHF